MLRSFLFLTQPMHFSGNRLQIYWGRKVASMRRRKTMSVEPLEWGEGEWQMKFHAKMNYKQIQKQTVNDLLEGEK